MRDTCGTFETTFETHTHAENATACLPMYTKSYRRIQAYREAESPRLAQEAANPPEVSFRLSTSKAHNLEIPHVLAKHWSVIGFFPYFCPFPFFFFPCPSTRNQSSLSLQNDPFRSTQHTRTIGRKNLVRGPIGIWQCKRHRTG